MRLGVQVFEFEPEAYARPFGALSDRPIALRAFAVLYTSPGYGEEPLPADQPGRTCLAVASDTGCRTLGGVAVHRDGDDLDVRFTGGTESQTSTRPYGPVAMLSMADAVAAGVRTINGVPPVPSTGLGMLTAFHRPGTGPFGEPPVVELGVGADTTGLAGALVHTDYIDAATIGDEGAVCVAAEHYLATFEIPADLIPPGAAWAGVRTAPGQAASYRGASGVRPMAGTSFTRRTGRHAHSLAAAPHV